MNGDASHDENGAAAEQARTTDRNGWMENGRPPCGRTSSGSGRADTNGGGYITPRGGGDGGGSGGF